MLKKIAAYINSLESYITEKPLEFLKLYSLKTALLVFFVCKYTGIDDPKKMKVTIQELLYYYKIVGISLLLIIFLSIFIFRESYLKKRGSMPEIEVLKKLISTTFVLLSLPIITAFIWFTGPSFMDVYDFLKEYYQELGIEKFIPFNMLIFIIISFAISIRYIITIILLHIFPRLKEISFVKLRFAFTIFIFVSYLVYSIPNIYKLLYSLTKENFKNYLPLGNLIIIISCFITAYIVIVTNLMRNIKMPFKVWFAYIYVNVTIMAMNLISSLLTKDIIIASLFAVLTGLSPFLVNNSNKTKAKKKPLKSKRWSSERLLKNLGDRLR
jgi:hypothetical protein